MIKSAIRDNVLETLSHMTLGSGERSIKDILTKEEILELANKVTMTLPYYPESTIEEVEYFVLETYTEEERDLIINVIIKDLIRLLLVNKQTKEQMSLLIFYMMYLYSIQYKDSITKGLHNTKKYFLSHIIYSSEELTEQVQFNPMEGTTRVLRENYIRINSDLNLIPNKETLLEFTNFLYSKNPS